MTILKIQSARKNEKGIALIFTLIMLSLLMILALSFALDSMFEQKAAYNSASSSSSGFMAQAQLKQVLLLMKEGEANFDSDGYLYSHDSGSATDTDMLIDCLPVDGVLKGDSDNPTDSDKNDKVFDLNDNGTYDDPKVNWNYIKTADGSIIGRTAFVVVPKEKIPLNSLISKTVDESGNLATGPEVYSEQRIGKNVSEINIRNAMYIMTAGDDSSTYTITPAMADIFNWLKTESGVTSNRTAGKFTGFWYSYSYIFGTSVLDLDSEIANDANRALFKQNFINSFELDAKDDKEAFWADTGPSGTPDGKIDSDELYKRFDLTRADWDTTEGFAPSFVNKILLLTTTGTTPNDAMENWVDEDSFDDTSDVAVYLANYSKGLPWLACFGYKTDGTLETGIEETFASVYERRCQIAANLKDYSDTDDIPSSNIKPSLWISTVSDIKYTGNEKTPYINKVGVNVDITLSQDAFALTTDIVAFARPSVGLINMYGTDYADIQFTVKGSVTIEVSYDDGANYSAPISLPIDGGSKTITQASNWSVAYSGHSTFVEGPAGSVVSMSETGPVAAKIRVTNVTVTKVVLHDGSYGYDYVKTLTWNPSGTDFIAFPNSATAATKVAWFGFEVNDPRQNLNADDWVIFKPFQHLQPFKVLSVSSTVTPEGEPNNTNSNTVDPSSIATIEDPTLGPDTETVTDSANSSISTAYIRNGPMESPWELGFIHRGAKWETLNLKKYDPNKGIKTVTIGTDKYIPGGGLYAAGDANILDQVKMTKSAESPEKINIAVQRAEILKALFSNIKTGSIIDSTMTVGSMADTGTVLTLTDANRTTIMNFFASPDTTTFTNLTRASIADDLNTFTGGTTDAAQEELIGKMINLTKVGGQNGSGSYTIIVLAQSIKDIGTSTGITIYKYSDDGTSGNKLCKLGVFDADNITDGDPDTSIYYDEITAEQKIIAEISKSTDNTITINSFQYVD